jgi:hypothetical protein
MEMTREIQILVGDMEVLDSLWYDGLVAWWSGGHTTDVLIVECLKHLMF